MPFIIIQSGLRANRPARPPLRTAHSPNILRPPLSPPAVAGRYPTSRRSKPIPAAQPCRPQFNASGAPLYSFRVSHSRASSAPPPGRSAQADPASHQHHQHPKRLCNLRRHLPRLPLRHSLEFPARSTSIPHLAGINMAPSSRQIQSSLKHRL